MNAYIGLPLRDMLEAVCVVTGQSKTVAVERAIRAYCLGMAGGQPAKDGQDAGGAEQDGGG